jgi:hypothetical protein
MSLDKAQEIIKRAMADRTVYDAMVARENEVWGQILPDRERSEAATEDANASAILGLCRNQSTGGQYLMRPRHRGEIPSKPTPAIRFLA